MLEDTPVLGQTHSEPTEELRPRADKEHTPERIRERLQQGSANYLSDFIYGAIDGTVTTFAVVSGVAGAELSSNIIIILGLANLIGDGFSMAASNFLGTRADEQLESKARADEVIQIGQNPDGEREEVREIFRAKGFAGEDLERVVDVICSNERVWIDTMLREELGLQSSARSPIRAAAATFVAFLIVGFIPLLPFVAQYFAGVTHAPFGWSCVLTAVAFFSVGAAKARFVHQHWFLAGAETLLLGGSAAALAYFVGSLLRGIG